MLLIRDLPVRHLDEADPDVRRGDWNAAIALFLVALPLCLGIAMASGTPLLSGLVSGIIGGLVVGPLSGAALLVSGPAAGLLPIVVGGVGQMGSFEAFLAVTLLAGAMQIGFSLLRWGELGAWVPAPVVRGLLTAIGLILVLKQVPHALGHDTDPMGDEAFVQFDGANTFSAIGAALHDLHPLAVASAAAAALVYAFAGRNRAAPASLLAVLTGTIVAWVGAKVAPGWSLDPTHFVDLPSMGRGHLAMPRPDLSALLRLDAWVLAAELALVASLETLLSLEATDRLDPYRRISDPDRELLAQGLGNLVAGLLGALPIAGVVVRSATAVSAGAATRFATVAHGGLLAAALMLFPALLELIPLATLAALLVFVGGRHARPRVWREAWARGPGEFFPFTATVLAILFSDLLPGVLFGVGVSAAMSLRAAAEHSGFFVRREPGGAVLWQLDETVSFQHKARVRRELLALPPLSTLHIDGRRCRVLDPDVRTLLADFRMEAERRHITYTLTFPEDGSAVGADRAG